ncbi:C-terminal binding protein [candidate division KSB3 bacterium]|uniref:C-terminal binding protein n=1 Tax=candidate division KSB3 bacterium TaxID=2044937 RepID=A0A9D5Q4C5_9BACT|nr:C-terminal binding protein [candidate division KSB3 bacterium]MBD3323113.1 C-terminal binding protein [candidate division KSB3 bacterium]
MDTHVPLRVVITDCDFGAFACERQELEGIAELAVYQCQTEDDVIAVAQEADGLLVQYAPITRRVMQSLKKCQAIGRYGIGVDTIDVPAATDYGIAVVNVPDYCFEEVSDHALALLLACVRKLRFLDSTVRAGQWDVQRAAPIYRLRECTVGLIGFGNIAQRVTQKLAGFGCPLLAYDPYAPSELFRQYGVTSANFDQILRQADILSIHVPLTTETHHLFDEHAFRRMKPEAFLINTSRGAIIDEQALYTALQEHWIAGAALDVVEEERLSPDSELLTLDNLLITPHAAFYSVTALQELQKWTARGVAQVLQGQIPTYLVNKELMHTRFSKQTP